MILSVNDEKFINLQNGLALGACQANIKNYKRCGIRSTLSGFVRFGV